MKNYIVYIARNETTLYGEEETHEILEEGEQL